MKSNVIIDSIDMLFCKAVYSIDLYILIFKLEVCKGV